MNADGRGGAVGISTDEADLGEVSILRLANASLRGRRLIWRSAVVGFLVAVALTLVQPRTYSTTSSFSPQTRRTPSALGGLAAQLGLSLLSADVGQSPNFYADLVKSRNILGQMADSPFVFAHEGRVVSGNWDELSQIWFDRLDILTTTPALRRERAIKRLSAGIDPVPNPKTGVVRVTVTARYPELALEANLRLLRLLNQFNLENRQTQAQAERRFIEQRVDEVRRDLRAAEDRLKVFLQQNREYRNSPEFTFQYDRLARDVSMQQQLFTTVSEAFEQAKIDEVRDTPVISMVERPELPVRPDSRGLILKALLGLVVGGTIGTLLAIGRASLSDMRRSQTVEAAEFDRHVTETLAEWSKPWRRLRGLIG